MTLRQFLTVTAEIGDRDVRLALALALKKEVPRSRQSYVRFYRRVIEDLAASGALAESTEHAALTGVWRARAVVGNRGAALADVARRRTMARTANTPADGARDDLRRDTVAQMQPTRA